MALKQKLDPDDIALLEIFEDPIWLGEFLRSTDDGEIDKNLHPPEKWSYRDYQRQFLSDKTEFILYTGGRSIGKCQPRSARIYTTEGYKTIGQLIERNSFVVYSLTADKQLEQRRAVLSYDKMSPAYTVTTDSGHKVAATMIHPFLTPNGYKKLEDLKIGDYVAVLTYLPHESSQNALQWHELRILGYTILLPRFWAENNIMPRYKKVAAELEIIADRMFVTWHKNRETGAYALKRKPGPFKHPYTSLQEELAIRGNMRTDGIKKLPALLKQERLENLQIFLEAVLAQFADLSAREFSLKLKTERLAEDFQELFLRFGIETTISQEGESYRITSRDYRAAYRMWTRLTIPGISVHNPQQPPASEDATEFMRFERIANIHQSHMNTDTYALYVYETNNYISENFLVHNSVVLEDKIVYDVVNQDIQFPVTKQSVLVTPNQAQMTPLLNLLIVRFSSGRVLKDFLQNRVNKSDGTMQFTLTNKPMIFHFRIAGSTGERNMIGLHIPRILGDESQLFPLNAYTQLSPAYNQWDKSRQQVWAGVPNGLRNSALYVIDQQTPKFKKYHIPSHMNPYYTYENDQDNIKRWGGELDDRYQQLVLGRHGQAAFQVIPRESITIETYPFTSERYNSGHVLKGMYYYDVLTRPNLPSEVKSVVLAIDPGFVDPTIIQVIGKDSKGVWRTYIRYRLTRIDFNEQQQIIDWLATFYNASRVAIDIGAGGNGSAMMHNLMYDDKYANKDYIHRMFGAQFGENLVAGFDDEGEELKQDSKSYAANELSKVIQEGRLRFSEIDHEGLSQMERVTKQKSTAAKDRYFILSDKGAGADEDDHIFAAYIVFILAIRNEVLNPLRPKLANPVGLYQPHILK
jgi:intein-like protein with splicing domain/terminase large subunit-like protein